MAGVPGAANVDGFARVDAGHFYVSFAANTTLPGLGVVARRGRRLLRQRHLADVLRRHRATDCRRRPTSSPSRLAGQTLYLSLSTTALPPGAGGTAGLGDVYQWNGAAATPGWSTPRHRRDARQPPSTRLEVRHRRALLGQLPGTRRPPSGRSASRTRTSWSTPQAPGRSWFDGTAAGLTTAAQDLDAFSLPTGADPMPAPPAARGPAVLLHGRATPTRRAPAGTGDDADLYSWSGTAHSRMFDATRGAGCRRAPTSTASTGSTTRTSTCPSTGHVTAARARARPGRGRRLLRRTAPGRCTSTAPPHGLTAAGEDVDAFSIVGGHAVLLHASAAVNPPGVRGTADDADVYGWNGDDRSPGCSTPRPTGSPATPTSTAWCGPTPPTSTCRSPTPRPPCPGSARSRTRTSSATTVARGRSTSTAPPMASGTADGLDVDAFDLP